jgi:hypothetical protein
LERANKSAGDAKKRAVTLPRKTLQEMETRVSFEAREGASQEFAGAVLPPVAATAMTDDAQ